MMDTAAASAPESLITAIRTHRIVPFVGAGVSMGVARGLFPSWGQLLDELVAQVAVDARAEDAARVRDLMTKGDYLAAAEVALRALGEYRFNAFLRKRFRRPCPPDADLRVVSALWALRPRLVITTNYDGVLGWGGTGTIQIVANDQDEELTLLDEATSEMPWIWHLHGTIDRMATVILAGSDYKRLYKGDKRKRSRLYEQALFTLQRHLASRPFLYVGFGLGDPYVLQQIRHVLDITRGTGAPSYALMKKGQASYGDLWENYNIQLVEYEDHGAPLAALLQGMAGRAFGAAEPPRDASPVARPAPAPAGKRADSKSILFDALSAGEDELPAEEYAAPTRGPRAPAPPTAQPAPPAQPTPQVLSAPVPAHDLMPRSTALGAVPAAPVLGEKPIIARPELIQAYGDELEHGGRLLLLAPERGGASRLARQIAERFGNRVTWLIPPSVPGCTEDEYCSWLTQDAAVSSFLELGAWLEQRARAAGGRQLVVVRHDGGPLDHLTSLGNVLRALIEDAGLRGLRFHVLVAGRAACARLRFQALDTSLYSGAPVRHVPPFREDEVAAVLDKAGRDGARRGRDVWRATGGLPGLVVEAVVGGQALDFESVTGRLVHSSSVHGRLRMRLGADDRDAESETSTREQRRGHARDTLKALLRGEPVRALASIEDDLRYPEVRLYYDGLVMDDASGATVFRCEAVRRAAERVLGQERG